MANFYRHFCIVGICLFGFSPSAFSEDENRGILSKGLLPDSLVEDFGIDVRGFLSAGYTFNTSHSDGYNGPVSFNDRSNEPQVDQAYLILERKTEKDGPSLGGRIDLIYGADATFTKSIGFDDHVTADKTSEIYKLEIPQGYVELNTGVGDGLSVKAGHFYTLIGYETVPAADNFFYSHAYSMQYGEPFTHWGALASYPISDKVTVTGGLVRGWDNFSDYGDGNLSFMGSIGITPNEDTSLTFALIQGNEGPHTNITMYSLVLVRSLSESLSLILQHDLGSKEGLQGEESSNWYSANSYLVYNLNEKVDLGVRLEWFRDENGTRVVGLRSGAGGVPADYYAASIGANYKPCNYFTLRPEVRTDYQDIKTASTGKAFGHGSDSTQVLVGVNGIARF